MTLAQLKEIRVTGNHAGDMPIFSALTTLLLNEDVSYFDKGEAIHYVNTVVMGLDSEYPTIETVLDTITEAVENYGG